MSPDSQPAAAEIDAIVAGTALVAAIEDDARERGVRLLQVKTLGASHPDEFYAHAPLLRERGLPGARGD